MILIVILKINNTIKKIISKIIILIIFLLMKITITIILNKKILLFKINRFMDIIVQLFLKIFNNFKIQHLL